MARVFEGIDVGGEDHVMLTKASHCVTKRHKTC